MHFAVLIGESTTTTAKPLDAGGAVVLIAFLAAFIGLIVYAKWRPRQQTQQMARQYGWTFTKRNDQYLDRFDTWPFYLGRAHRVTDIATGTYNGHPVEVFDFSFIDSQGGIGVGIGPIGTVVGATPRRADVGIFAGYDIGLGVQTGQGRFGSRNRGSGDRPIWSICVMELPGPLPQVLVRESYGSVPTKMIEELVGGSGATNPDTTNLPTGDSEFDKAFAVRAQDPTTATRLLPKATRDLLVANVDHVAHKSLHVWTWDRYLFTLETRPLSIKAIEERLSLMAAMIENYGKA